MGRLVIFVLDTETGRPAEKLATRVSCLLQSGAQTAFVRRLTAADGCARLEVGHDAGDAITGCRVELDTGAWFQSEEPPTFPVTCVEFSWDGHGEMVLPVLVSKHGYTTYRGY